MIKFEHLLVVQRSFSPKIVISGSTDFFNLVRFEKRFWVKDGMKISIKNADLIRYNLYGNVGFWFARGQRHCR